MEYRVLYKKSVHKDFRRIPLSLAGKVKKAIEDCLRTDPFQEKALKGRFKGLHRLKIGPFRAIYHVEKKDVLVLVLRVSDRKDVYRGLLR